MSVTTKTYKVNNYKQLIELNGNKTNFDLSFEVKSENGEPFKALVISETDLNAGNQINYQDVKNGHISGNIKNDKGVFQTYFLLLKSDGEEINCDVTLDLKDIPLNPEVQKMREEQARERQEQIMNQRRQLEEEDLNKNLKKNIIETPDHPPINRKQIKKEDGINWVLVIGIVVLVGVGIWFFITSKKVKTFKAVNVDGVSGTTRVSEESILQLTNDPINIETSIKLPELSVPIETPVIPTVLPSLDLTTKSDSGINLDVPKVNLAKNDGLMRKLNNFFDS